MQLYIQFKEQYKINQKEQKMTKNYFSIERGQRFYENVTFRDDNGNIAFEELMNMSYDEMKTYEGIEAFVACVMDAGNELFSTNDDQTIITLIGEDDVFVWSVIVGVGESDGDLKYVFVDWKKDGKSYRYEN